MRIETIPEHALSRDQDAEIGALLDVTFGTEAGFSGRSFHKMRHHLRYLVRDHGRLIGHAAVQMRAIRQGSRPLTIAGLAEVATHPLYRHQGVATALVRAALTGMSGTIAEFAVLFGYPALYATLGFQPAANPVTYVSFDSGRPVALETRAFDSFMVCPLGSDPWNGTEDVDLCGPLF